MRDGLSFAGGSPGRELFHRGGDRVAVAKWVRPRACPTHIAAAMFALMLVYGGPATAQGLTTEQVAGAFVEGVEICARAAIADVAIASLPEEDRARLSPASGDMRAFARAPEGRPVWDVLSAQGIVTIVEPAEGRCDVTAYGPSVRPTFERVAASLTDGALGFAQQRIEDRPDAILRAFNRNVDGREIRVLLDGGEPGMPGRMFRFPLLLGYVSHNEPSH